MQPKIANSLISVCSCFEKNQVQYLIVGGFAVGLHGYSRITIDDFGHKTVNDDFDFWYNPTYNNYFNLLNALECLGQDVLEFKKEKAPNPYKSFFKYKFPEFSLDLLPSVLGLNKFSDSFAKRDIIKINGMEIGFVCLEDLFKSKLALNRNKDIIDIEQLKKINKNNLL